MKQGKRLTREQKEWVKRARLDPANWSYVRDTDTNKIQIINKTTGSIREVLKKLSERPRE